MYGGELSTKPLFVCEIIPWRLTWAVSQASPSFAFRDMSELVGGLAAFDTLQNVSVAVPAPDALSLGPPCKDFTGKNNKQKELANCVEENVGVSGSAIHVIKNFIGHNQPMLVILEQVAGADRQFSSLKATNWQNIIELVHSQGYVVRDMTLAALNHLPQRRTRKYLVAVHKAVYDERLKKLFPHDDHRRPLEACLDECQSLIGTCESARLPEDLVFGVSDFLLAEDHDLLLVEFDLVRNKAVLRLGQNPESLRVERRKAGKKRKLSSLIAEDVDEDIESEADGEDVVGLAPWIATHEREYEKAGLTYSPAHQNPLAEAYRGNPWYEHLTPRYQECILFWDEVAPVADADPESFLDLHPVACAQLLSCSLACWLPLCCLLACWFDCTPACMLVAFVLPARSCFRVRLHVGCFSAVRLHVGCFRVLACRVLCLPVVLACRRCEIIVNC